LSAVDVLVQSKGGVAITVGHHVDSNISSARRVVPIKQRVLHGVAVGVRRQICHRIQRVRIRHSIHCVIGVHAVHDHLLVRALSI